MSLFKTRKLHLFLVFLQFGGIFFFLLTGHVLHQKIYSGLLLVLSVLLGIWAVLSMNRQTITFLPDVRRNASLTTVGPYRWIRHPMYTSVIFFLLALMLNYFTYMRLTVFLMVLSALYFKIRIEEKILLKKYPDYASYMKFTWKVIPFIF